jgi:hypothetical protein
VVNAMAALRTRNRPGTILYEAVWASGPVWTGAENFAPTRFRFPDRLTRSESLCQPRHPGPYYVIT